MKKEERVTGGSVLLCPVARPIADPAILELGLHVLRNAAFDSHRVHASYVFGCAKDADESGRVSINTVGQGQGRTGALPLGNPTGLRVDDGYHAVEVSRCANRDTVWRAAHLAKGNER
jgi:hypothetical protein